MTHPEQTSPTADERAVEVVHGTVCLEDKAALHDAIAKQIRAGEQAAREEEREACAALIESHPRTPCNRNRDGCLAAQIRARAGEEGS